MLCDLLRTMLPFVLLLCTVTSPALVSTNDDIKNPSTGGECELPPYPQHGSYVVAGNPAGKPGHTYPNVKIDIACDSGFKIDGASRLLCINGAWSHDMPKCLIIGCQLPKHPSVEYRCTAPMGYRTCGAEEPSGSVVKPVCNEPYYISPTTLGDMTCINGSWSYIATCQPECGIVSSAMADLPVGDTRKIGELPWHALIYTKTTSPYQQICSGSLVSAKTVISAAHCFWSYRDNLLPSSDYAVAVGKNRRHWNGADSNAQKSHVSDIKVPVFFHGAATNYQGDIAVVTVETPFTFNQFVRPICIDFDVNFDRQQLNDANVGKIASWGLDERTNTLSNVLKVAELPYLDYEKCYSKSPYSFREYITADKICADTNGTTLCRGDGGSGLAFPDNRTRVRYYLRGVFSVAPVSEGLCAVGGISTFTHILKHEQFIKEAIY